MSSLTRLLIILIFMMITLSFVYCKDNKVYLHIDLPVYNFTTATSISVSENPVPSLISIPDISTVSGISPSQNPSVKPVVDRLPSVTPVPVDNNIKQPLKEKGFPVVFYGKELFFIDRGLGTFSPEERANIISNRLNKLAGDSKFQVDAIAVEIKNNNPFIIYKGIIIMGLTEEDAKSSGLTGQDLAEKYAEIIRNAMAEYKRAHSVRSIILGIVFFVITTLIFIIFFKILHKIVELLCKKINSWDGTRIRDIKFQNLVLLRGGKIIKTSTILIKVLYIFIKIIFFYIYLSLVFSFFIWTRDIGKKLFHYIFAGFNIIWLSLLSYLPDLFFVLLIVVITYYIIRFIRFIFNELEKGTVVFPGFYKEWAIPTYSIVRFVLISLSIVIILPYLPVYDTPAFKGISLFLGILFSLGSTAVVSNIIAGIILIYMNAFKIGDRVKIGDVTGDIIEKTLFVTHIRTIKNVDITLPNAMILGTYITNYSSSSQEQGLILNTTVTIGYDAPWRDVHRLLIDAALATKDIVKEPSPFVFQTALNDFYVSYEINAYTREPNKMANIYSDLHQNIQDKFNEGGVEIMSPHYTSLRDGNQTTIPVSHLPETYKAPEFRIFQKGNII